MARRPRALSRHARARSLARPHGQRRRCAQDVRRWHSLFVRAKDGHEALLGPADELTGSTFDAGKKEVTIELTTRFCQYDSQAVWPLASLLVRLENTPAYALHKKKDFKGALAGFQRALAADRRGLRPAAPRRQAPRDRDPRALRVVELTL